MIEVYKILTGKYDKDATSVCYGRTWHIQLVIGDTAWREQEQYSGRTHLPSEQYNRGIVFQNVLLQRQVKMLLKQTL